MQHITNSPSQQNIQPQIRENEFSISHASLPKFTRLPPHQRTKQRFLQRTQDFGNIGRMVRNVTAKDERVELQAEMSLTMVKGQLSMLEREKSNNLVKIAKMSKKIKSSQAIIRISEKSRVRGDEKRNALQLQKAQQEKLKQQAEWQNKSLRHIEKRLKSDCQVVQLRSYWMIKAIERKKFELQNCANRAICLVQTLNRAQAQLAKQQNTIAEMVSQSEEHKKQIEVVNRRLMRQNMLRLEGQHKNQLMREEEQMQANEVKVRRQRRVLLAQLLMRRLLECKSSALLEREERKGECFRRLKFELQINDSEDLLERYSRQSTDYKNGQQYIKAVTEKIRELTEQKARLTRQLQSREMDLLDMQGKGKGKGKGALELNYEKEKMLALGHERQLCKIKQFASHLLGQVGLEERGGPAERIVQICRWARERAAQG